MAWMVIVLMPDMVEAGSAHRSGTKLESCPRDSAPGAWGALHAQPPAAYRLARMRNGVDANSRRPENHSKSPYFSGDYGPVRSLIFFFWFFCFQVQTPNTKYFSIYFFEITDLSVSRPILPAVFQFLHYSHSVPGRYFGTTLNLVDFTPDVSKYGPVRSFRHSSLP